MKTFLSVILLSVMLFSCKKKEEVDPVHSLTIKIYSINAGKFTTTISYGTQNLSFNDKVAKQDTVIHKCNLNKDDVVTIYVKHSLPDDPNGQRKLVDVDVIDDINFAKVGTNHLGGINNGVLTYTVQKKL